jgi:hypothetical protein
MAHFEEQAGFGGARLNVDFFSQELEIMDVPATPIRAGKAPIDTYFCVH